MQSHTQILLALLAYAAALGLFLIEIFVPGGVLGIIGSLLLVYALWILFHLDQGALALVLMGLTAVYLVLTFRYGIRRLAHRVVLGPHIESGQSPSLKVGTRGTTLTALRPAGMGLFEGRRLDVVANGAFVEAGVAIEVLESTPQRIVVKPARSDEDVPDAQA